MKMPSRVLALFPQLTGPGGVQRLGRMMLRCTARWCSTRGVPLQVHSLRDESDDGFLPEGTESFLAGGSRVAFARAVRAGATKGTVAICAHPFITPVLLGTAARYLVHAHGIDVWEKLGWLRRKALREAAMVTTSSTDTAHRVRELQGVAPERTTVLWPALDASFPMPEQKTSESPIILSLARLSRGDVTKGIPELLEIFASLAPEFPEWQLLVAGDGDDRARLEAMANMLAPGRVSFAGRVSDAELHALLREAAVFALPSRKEGFGIVYVEAMANALPVLAVSAGGITDVVVHEETGLLPAPGDAGALRTALTSLMSDADLRRRLGAAGRRRVLEHFTESAFQSRMDALLEALCQ